MMKGSCLCGAIEISAPAIDSVSVCHCSMCRRWGGGPLFTVHYGPEVSLGIQGQPAVYRSSEWAERAFCPACGTHLYYRLISTNEYALPAGIFPDAARLALTSQIFIDEKPAYYELANQTETLTGAEVFARYSDVLS